MTIERARKILKMDEDKYPDEEIVKILDFTDILVDAVYNKLKTKYPDNDFTEANLQINNKRLKRLNLFTKLEYNSSEEKSKHTDTGSQ